MELGVGINVMPHPTRELTELGLLEELYEMGIPTAIPGARSLRYSGGEDDVVWTGDEGDIAFKSLSSQGTSFCLDSTRRNSRILV